ncbi:hypothetical protein bcgnr5406_38070 [Bacillus cereus]
MKINEPICACPSVVLIKWIIDLLQRELINKYIKEEGCLQHEKTITIRTYYNGNFWFNCLWRKK